MSEKFEKLLAEAEEALLRVGTGRLPKSELVTEGPRSYTVAVPVLPTGQPRRFYLKRTKDISGVSGVGIVAEGCVFANHRCVLSWLPVTTSFEIFDNVEDLLKIHGHNGCTTIQYLDPL